MDGLLQDLRLAVRFVMRGGIVPLLAILCLALGIGLNTAGFTMLRGSLYRDLGVAEADRIVVIESTSPERGEDVDEVTAADVTALAGAGLFDAVGLIQGGNTTLTDGDAEPVTGFSVSPGLFPMLGVQPQLGRGFLADEGAAPGQASVALVSDALWKRRFGARPDVVGSTLHLNGRALQVVGVMPAGFRFPEVGDVWVPLATVDPTDTSRRSLVGLGRLAPGVTLDEARTRARAISSSMAAEHPETHRGYELLVDGLRHALIGSARGLFLMMGAVALVLLIACVNVASLLLARAGDRVRDVAVRAALGASRARMIRQALVEALVLSAVSAWAGWLLAGWFVDATLARIPEQLPYWMRFDPDWPVLAFTLAVTVGTALLFGAVPALQASRLDLTRRMGGRGHVGGPTRTLAGLVGVEVGLSLVLLVGAGLLMRSSRGVTRTDIGLPTDATLSLRLPLSDERFTAPADRIAFVTALAGRLEASPEVAGAVVTTSIPADDGGASTPVRADVGMPLTEAPNASVIGWTGAGPSEVGGRLRSGRGFTPGEGADPAADVAIVGRSLARRVWGAEDPLGRTLIVDTIPLRVVGVVDDIVYEELSEQTEVSGLQVHVPYARMPNRVVALLVRARASADASSLVPTVRAELRRLDALLAPYEIMTMRERRQFTFWEDRLLGILFSELGAVALLLAAAGVYGVVAYGVARRRRELSVRMVLGAPARTILRGLVRATLIPAGIGAAAGLAVALALSRVMAGLLYGVAPTDPVTFFGAGGAMLVVALVAAIVPARRALKLDPAEALKSE